MEPPVAPELYGHDATSGIIDVQLLGSPHESSPAWVQVYARNLEDGSLQTTASRFHPFFFLTDIRLLKGFERDRYRFSELAGTNAFRYLVVFEHMVDYWHAVEHLRRSTDTQARTPSVCYLPGTPVQQFLMQSGKTSFKDMAFNDLHRLQLDIEVYTEGRFPQASRPEDAIIIIALSDNRGWSHLIDGQVLDEREMLLALVEVIQARDPDVIEGHNIYRFDFPYLMARCKQHGVSFAIGRDGTVPRTFSSSMRFAERSVAYEALDIAGRHVVDTYFQVLSYDVFKRDLPGYGLKQVARHFGFAAADRTYVPGDQIGRVWKTDPARLLDYALDDVFETEQLARLLSGSTFYLAQMLPMPYGQVARTGPASKIESLFVREYLRQRQSLPRSEWGSQHVGGYTDVFCTGVLGPIVYADVESLYPSIMLEYDVRPERDSLGIFPTLLRKLTKLRFATKQQMHDAADEDARRALDAQQGSYKNLINSFYGNLSFSLALFNDYSEADRVATTGQALLRRIIRTLVAQGATVIEVDTDGVLFIPPSSVRGEGAERAFVARLNESMPSGIRVGYDGRFEKMLSYKAKNYALLRYDGTLKLKGSSLIARSTERFGRSFVKQGIRLLLAEDIAGLHHLYLATRHKIIHHEWESVEDFSRTETLKDTLARYTTDVAAGKRQRAASYELAIRHQESSGRRYLQGDRISYYLAGPAQAPAYETAKLAETWSATQPDEQTAYYLRRLDEFARKFAPFFSGPDFKQVFSPEDLFGFDPEGIQLVTQRRTPTEVEDNVPF